MGDIDVVVPDDHVTAAVHTLRERGFAPRIVDGSEHGWARAAHQGTFVSDSGGLVDLHSPAGHPRVFSDLFDEPGQLVRALDRPLWVPSNEASLTIAVWHALKSTASSDRVQALLDMSALLPLVDPERARTLLLRSDLNRPASDLLSELRDLDLLDATSWQALDRIGPGEHLVRWRARWRRFTDKCKRVSSLPKVLRRRRLTLAERQSLQVLRGPRARLYMVWSRLGQIRALERALHVAIGGFGDLGPAGGPIPQRDFRATLPTRQGIRRTLIVHFTFDEDMGEPPHRLLFIDGLLHGTVPLPGNVPGRYEVMPDRDHVEVSARHLSSTTPSIVQTVRIEWA
jgi:hypothetical protein